MTRIEPGKPKDPSIVNFYSAFFLMIIPTEGKIMGVDIKKQTDAI